MGFLASKEQRLGNATTKTRKAKALHRVRESEGCRLLQNGLACHSSGAKFRFLLRVFNKPARTHVSMNAFKGSAR